MTPHDDPPAAVGLNDAECAAIRRKVKAEAKFGMYNSDDMIRAGFAAAQSAPQVPREPTPKMVRAAHDGPWLTHKYMDRMGTTEIACQLWRAMCDAAQPAASARGVPNTSMDDAENHGGLDGVAPPIRGEDSKPPASSTPAPVPAATMR